MISPSLAERIEKLADRSGSDPETLLRTWVSRMEESDEKSATSTRRSVFDHLHDRVLILDRENRILQINQALATDYSVDPDASRNRPVSEVWEPYLPPEEERRLVDAITAVRTGDPAVSELEIRTRGPDGREHVEKGRVCRLDDSGDRVALIAWNVTGRRKTEERLRESETLFRRLAEQVPVAISIVQDGRLVYVNSAFEELTGYDQTEVSGRFTPLRLIHPDDRPDVREEYGRTDGTGPTTSVRQVRLLRRDGQKRTIRIYRAHVPFDGTAAILTVCTDVTEQLRTAEALRRAKEEAERANEMKATLLANMSHEFRTPLASVVGFADLLAAEVGDPHQRFVRMIRESGERLLTTLEAVLDLAQLEGEDLEIQPEELNVTDVLKDVVRSMEPQAQKKGLVLRMRMTQSILRAVTDRSALARISGHLIGNAVKFTEEGEVTVGLRAEADQLVLQVADTGIGIGPDHQPDVFDPFYQESKGLSREYGGAGLGLAITRRLADLLGGAIELESTPGEGTTVIVRLPREMPTPEESGPSLGSAHQWGLDQLPGTQRVLVVDDDRDMRELARQMLPSSFTVEEAADPAETLTLLEQQTFDLVLLDINLKQEMNGVDVLERLRKMDGSGDPIVVAMTAYALPGDGEEFLDQGFDGYLPKPFTRETLRTNLIQVLETDYE